MCYGENFLRETYRATRLPKLTRIMSTRESFYSLLSLLRYKGQLQEEQFQIQYTLGFGFVFSCCLSLSLPNIVNQESFLHSYYVHPPISNGRLREWQEPEWEWHEFLQCNSNKCGGNVTQDTFTLPKQPTEQTDFYFFSTFTHFLHQPNHTHTLRV